MILPETGRNKAPPASATVGAAACGCAAGAGAGALLGVAGRGAGAVLLAGAAALCCAGSVSLVMGAGKAWLAEGGGGGVEAPGTAPSAILPVAVSRANGMMRYCPSRTSRSGPSPFQSDKARTDTL